VAGGPVLATTPSGSTLRYQLVGGNAFAAARVELAPGQAIRAEGGAMVSMSGNVELDATLQGGLMGALKRMVTRESLFVSTFTAVGGAAEVILAPPVPGDIIGVDLAGRALLVQSSSWLASELPVQLDTEFVGGNERQRGLAEAGRAVQQDVIERFVALLRGIDEDLQVLFVLTLPDVFVERARTERQVVALLVFAYATRDGSVAAVFVLARHAVVSLSNPPSRREHAQGFTDEHIERFGLASTEVGGGALGFHRLEAQAK
jgi:hypothetical protein